MAIAIDAVYENGVLKPAQPLAVTEQQKVQVTMETPVGIQAALAAVQRGYGLLGWTGDRKIVERAALDPAFGIKESP